MTDAAARRFHIDACLGRGGFGEVYRARMTRQGGFEVEVALKLLRADVDPRGHATSRLRDEARMLGMVRHRCVPHVFDLVELDGRVGLVTEYVEGADLSKCLRSAPRIPRRACLEVLAGVADALHAAYNTPVRGGGFTRIVHRDLKPANVRIARDGTPKLLDFGIAWTDSVTRVAMTQSSALVGSPAYMAPERFDAAPPTAAVDVFGLGAMLYEALTGKRLFAEVPFKELAAIALVEARYLRALDERLAELPDDAAPELRALLAESLAFAPDTRPTTEQVARRLEALAANTPGMDLKAWCRDRTWAEDVGIGGPWCGRTLVEGQAASAPDDSTWPTPEPLLNLTPDVVTAESGPVELSEASLSSVGSTPARRSWAARPTPLLGIATPLVLGLLVAALWVQAAPTTRALAPSDAAVSVSVPQASSAPAAITAPPTVPADITTESPTSQPAPTAAPATPTATAPSAPRVSPAPRAAPSRVATSAVVLPSVDTLLDEDVADAPAPTRVMPAHAPVAAPPAPAPDPLAPTSADSVRRHMAGATAPAIATARVSLDAANRASEVTLVGNGGRFRLPAELSPGRYQVQADFGLGTLQSAGSVEVYGSDVAVRCAMNNCAIVH